ncbi:hypothetical protein HYH03_013238 [Edaphochlamys debaryana]|uniref:Protein kinase domain-containing protein n=1 Tax=Edaphochlamys debaryana TaxID=47281 RepID=A0A836BUQ3_9CHLO|nr:hypothetical protein HYH03_013238 [Edaphochlamys debaryana]|eukprot:KAG2488248.1 hypothetical protein HYH03_013238 [Edaphochlamys debaryana]
MARYPGRRLPPALLRAVAWQLLGALEHCHSHGVIHRDVKPSNVLIDTREGDGGEPTPVVKLCDFGLARWTPGRQPGAGGAAGGQRTGDTQGRPEPLSDYVVTRWYRAPELLVGSRQYGTPVDVWAAGCTLAELALGKPLFAGSSEADQMWLIVRRLGPMPYGLRLLNGSAAVDASRLRPTAGGSTPGPPGAQCAAASCGPDAVAAGLSSPIVARGGQCPIQALAGHLGPLVDPGLLQVIGRCLAMDPALRPTAAQLRSLPYFHGLRDPVACTPPAPRLPSQTPATGSTTAPEHARRGYAASPGSGLSPYTPCDPAVQIPLAPGGRLPTTAAPFARPLQAEPEPALEPHGGSPTQEAAHVRTAVDGRSAQATPSCVSAAGERTASDDAAQATARVAPASADAAILARASALFGPSMLAQIAAVIASSQDATSQDAVSSADAEPSDAVAGPPARALAGLSQHTIRQLQLHAAAQAGSRGRGGPSAAPLIVDVSHRSAMCAATRDHARTSATTDADCTAAYSEAGLLMSGRDSTITSRTAGFEGLLSMPSLPTSPAGLTHGGPAATSVRGLPPPLEPPPAPLPNARRKIFAPEAICGAQPRPSDGGWGPSASRASSRFAQPPSSTTRSSVGGGFKAGHPSLASLFARSSTPAVPTKPAAGSERPTAPEPGPGGRRSGGGTGGPAAWAAGLFRRFSLRTSRLLSDNGRDKFSPQPQPQPHTLNAGSDWGSATLPSSARSLHQRLTAAAAANAPANAAAARAALLPPAAEAPNPQSLSAAAPGGLAAAACQAAGPQSPAQDHACAYAPQWAPPGPGQAQGGGGTACHPFTIGAASEQLPREPMLSRGDEPLGRTFSEAPLPAPRLSMTSVRAALRPSMTGHVTTQPEATPQQAWPDGAAGGSHYSPAARAHATKPVSLASCVGSNHHQVVGSNRPAAAQPPRATAAGQPPEEAAGKQAWDLHAQASAAQGAANAASGLVKGSGSFAAVELPSLRTVPSEIFLAAPSPPSSGGRAEPAGRMLAASELLLSGATEENLEAAAAEPVTAAAKGLGRGRGTGIYAK